MPSITPIGIIDWRNQHQVFGIKDSDRLGHMYCIGKTGAGKSTLLLNLAISDIERGNGVCVIDPHGDLATQLLDYVPSRRVNDVIYLNVTDLDFPIGLNPLHNISPSQRNIVTSSIISAFKKVWADSWGPRLEHILRFSILTLLYYPKATLLDIQPLLTNLYFRNRILNLVPDQMVRDFWEHEYEKYSSTFKSEAIAPVLNKMGLLSASMQLRYIVGQQHDLHLRKIMDEQKIVICNLAKGVIGEEVSALLGSLIVTEIQSAALSRAGGNPEKRIPFYVYVDEMHSFVTLSFADVLAEARKYGVGLFLTHQYLSQIDERIRSAIFGNVGTLISFRVGAEDAIEIAKEFSSVFKENDLVSLPKYSMYLKLMIDGATSKPFSAISLPRSIPVNSFRKQIIQHSQEAYGTQRAVIEESLQMRHKKGLESMRGTLFPDLSR